MTPRIPLQAMTVTGALRERLGDALIAVILYGSCVDGGLQPASDLDLMAVLRRPLGDDERAGCMSTLLGLSSPPGSAERRAVEVTCVVLADIVPWRHPAMRELQFGEWLRDALLQKGEVPPREPDPDLALLLTQARATGIALHGPAPASLLSRVPAADVRAAMLTMLPGLVSNLAGEETHALLTLARMQVTLETGAIVPKDVAVSIVGPGLQAEHRGVLERAQAVYRGEVEDDWQDWAERVAHCTARMQADITHVGHHTRQADDP